MKAAALKQKLVAQYRGPRFVNEFTEDPNDILTPQELAKRLKTSVGFIYEQTRQRATVRGNNPMPFHRVGKKQLRFSWKEIVNWLNQPVTS